jgi:hypothetical protein
MSEPKHLTFGGRSLPIDLVGAEADSLGRALSPAQFDFTYRQIRFACRCDETAGQPHLKLVGDVGPLPFSAESPTARAAIQAIVDSANATLGPVFRLTNGRVLLGGEGDLPSPVTATDLISAVVRFVLPARPYLELIAEVVRPPMAPAKPGEAHLREAWRRQRRR